MSITTDDILRLSTRASGSAGSVVASHNGAGRYFRARTIPTDPATTLQLAVRTAMASLVAIWSGTLTEQQRQNWAVYATNVPLVNALGHAIHVSPLNHYIRSNLVRLHVDQPTVDLAPKRFNVGLNAPLSNVIAHRTPSTITGDFDDTQPWATEGGSFLALYASPSIPPAINFYKGPFRLIGTVPVRTVTYNQTNALPTVCTPLNPWCSGLAVAAAGYTRQAIDGGTLGGNAGNVQVNIKALQIGINYLIESPTFFTPGDWTVTQNIAVFPIPLGPLSWGRINICHVNRTAPCNSIATLGTLLGPSLPCTSGNKVGVVTGALGVPSPGPNDGIAIALGFNNAVGATPESFFGRSSRTIVHKLIPLPSPVSPFTLTLPTQPTVGDSTFLRVLTVRVDGRVSADRIYRAPTLLL